MCKHCVNARHIKLAALYTIYTINFGVPKGGFAAIGTQKGYLVGNLFGHRGRHIGLLLGNRLGNDLGNGLGNDLGNGLGNDLGNGSGNDLGNGLGNDLGNGLGNGSGNDLGNGLVSKTVLSITTISN